MDGTKTAHVVFGLVRWEGWSDAGGFASEHDQCSSPSAAVPDSRQPVCWALLPSASSPAGKAASAEPTPSPAGPAGSAEDARPAPLSPSCHALANLATCPAGKPSSLAAGSPSSKAPPTGDWDNKEGRTACAAGGAAPAGSVERCCRSHRCEAPPAVNGWSAITATKGPSCGIRNAGTAGVPAVRVDGEPACKRPRSCSASPANSESPDSRLASASELSAR
eukprot:355090-Chlamydomonas_euryale.AAC.2